MPNDTSFNYSAPAELFLAKRAKKNYWRFTTAAEAIRFAVEDLRTPKASARPCRSAMSASTAAKSNAFTKPRTIRCASLSDRAPARFVQDNGSFQPTNLRISTRTPGFQKLGVNPGLGSNHGASSERSEPQRIYSSSAPRTLPLFGFTKCA